MTYEASPDEQPDWSLVEIEEQNEGSYLFRVGDFSTRRGLAFQMASTLGLDKYDLESLGEELANPKPIQDLRLDGNQISFTESDETKRMRIGKITYARIYMKYGKDDPAYLEKYNLAIKTILDKIHASKNSKPD